MRILILANNDVGLYRFRKELIEELLNLGHDVHISLPYGDLVRPLESLGCIFINTNIDRRGMNPKTDYELLIKYRRMMKEIKPDLVITYTIKPNIYGGIAARQAKIPYAVNITGLGTAFEKPCLIKKLVINLYKYALKKAKVIFFENSSNRDEMVSYGCCASEQTCVLNGAGVNTQTFAYQPYPHNKEVRFLFVGRVMKEKGVDELFNAMRQLLAEGECCFLDVVGPLEEDYKAELEQFEVQGWLKYHGYQEDVRPFIKNCDCFVLPSYHEGMANTNLECASSGRPVITSNIPGCKEAVIDGVSGFLCEPRNMESLHFVMRKMINTDDREQMGRMGRMFMEKEFSKEKVVFETISAINIEVI